MNKSGGPLAAYIKNKNIEPQQILVVHDEVSFPVGKNRYKFAGSEAGHNGLASISTSLRSRDYWRLRIGVGRPLPPLEVNQHVMSAPPPEEQQVYEESIEDLIASVRDFVWHDKNRAIQEMHSK